MKKEIDLTQLAEALLRADDTAQREDYAGLREDAVCLLDTLRRALFPQIFCRQAENEQAALQSCARALEQAGSLVRCMVRRLTGSESAGEQAAETLLSRLPALKQILKTDVAAAYEGDPAARSMAEVMLSYPAFTAIFTFRIAHELYLLSVPILPRMMTEYAHSLTGIDIHPGATIGPYFFIDHGTGVVVGETTVIGAHVKLYQGVTLGARSFPTNPDGSLVKGIKRHPEIGDRVIIYAGATILGGGTRIGSGSVIGGNVWLTSSVPENSTVTQVRQKAGSGRPDVVQSIQMLPIR